MKKILFTILLLGALLFVGCGAKQDGINVYSRDDKSGTRDGFMTNIGLSEAKEDNGPLVDSVSIVGGNGEMITKILNDEYGIGYISLASLKDSGVKGLSYEGVTPTEENVLNKTYKMTRNFNYIVRSEYSSDTKQQIIEAFVAYLGTKEGKATIKAYDGILEINDSDPTWDSIKDNYPVTKLDNSNVEILVGGSTSVDKMAQGLTKEFSGLCGGFRAVHAATGSGDAYKRTQGSEKDGANALDLAFASREFNSNEAYAEGTIGKLCVDAIVAVVNNKNEVSNVTALELKKIYTGEITKWSDVK